MKNTGKPSKSTLLLRRKAEKFLKKTLAKADANLSESDILKLMHELEVHQIELELQNNELMQALSAAQDAIELYDVAPSGYFTLSRHGEILKLNICGSQMLGKERSRLVNSRFGFFISDDTKPAFNTFLEKVFKSKAKESCELTLSTNDGQTRYAHLSGIVAKNGEHCLVIMVDITAAKQNHEAIVRKNIALEEVMAQVESEKQKLRVNISANVKKVILPILQKMAKQGGLPEYKKLLERSLKELTSSFGKEITTDIEDKLTAKEIDICAMIRAGMKNKEIAGFQKTAISTVETERKNIRKKLSLTKKKTNLATFLQNIH
jgi:PAS domain S-box-containing protein